MISIPVSFGAFVFSPKYQALIDEGAPLTGRANALTVQRVGNWPVYAGKAVEGMTLPIKVIWPAGLGGNLEELKAKLLVVDPAGEQPPQALVLSDGSSQWYYEAVVLAIDDLEGNSVMVMFYIAEPVLRAVTTSAQNVTLTGNSTNASITSNGTIPTKPVLTITPNAAKTVSGAYQNRISCILYNKLDDKVSRWPIDITNGGLNTAALVSGGYLQASCVDLRVFVDGVETPRYLGNPNAANTKVWVNFDFSPLQKCVLSGAMAAGDTITSLQLKKDNHTKKFLGKVPASGAVLIDSELFTYSGRDVKAYTLTGVCRAQRLTSAAGHSAGALVYWVEHDVAILYGNAGAYAGDSYDNQDARAPMFDLASSSNSSWVYADFADAAKLRTGLWENQVSKRRGNLTFCATADPTVDADGMADPASMAGLWMIAYKKGAKWQAEDAELEWRLNNPAGIAAVTLSGKKYFAHAWPKVQLKRYTSSGWKVVYTEAQGNPASWQAWSASNLNCGNSVAIRVIMDGALPQKDSNTFFGIDAATAAINTANLPFIAVINPGAISSNYPLIMEIANATTGDYLVINWPGKVGESLVVDCESKTASSPSMPNAAMCVYTPVPRAAWMSLAAGANSLTISDNYSTNVLIRFEWKDRAA
jgi:hypothetical protein